VHLLEDLKAGEDRKLNVQEHKVGLFALNKTQGLLTVGGRQRFVPHPRDAVLQCQDNVRIVVDDQYPSAHGSFLSGDDGKVVDVGISSVSDNA
jgi:hypothetical protein